MKNIEETNTKNDPDGFQMDFIFDSPKTNSQILSINKLKTRSAANTDSSVRRNCWKEEKFKFNSNV